MESLDCTLVVNTLSCLDKLTWGGVSVATLAAVLLFVIASIWRMD